MSRLRVAIDISATPAQVWDAVEPVEDHVEWMHDAVAIRFQTDQHRGVGTAFLCDTKVGPFELVDSMEITEWEPGVTMGVRHVGVVTGTGRFTLDTDRPRPAHAIQLGGIVDLPVVAWWTPRRARRRPRCASHDLEAQPDAS